MSYSKSDLRRLHDAAVEYISIANMERCNWFYRNKSNDYFTSIEASGGVMGTQVKDNGGDPRSPINGRLRGLFFMANNVNGEPPPYSYFGPIRIQIAAGELLHSARNLYFADFYCMKGRRHYVILVITRPGSHADWFCQSRLVQLDITNNPFLCFSMGQLYTTNTDNFDVEVFYTEDLNISELQIRGKASMTTVETRGQGHSTLGGRRKDTSCSICNP